MLIIELNPKYYFIFFFQAEDGIRDLTVTGVQTCALPICNPFDRCPIVDRGTDLRGKASLGDVDRKSTRLNSSHSQISYAVFCLKKKKNMQINITRIITITK